MHSQPARRLYVRFKILWLCPDGVAAPRQPASGSHLCFGPWLAGGGVMAQTQFYTIPVSGGGTLTLSYSQQSTCDGGFAEQWNGQTYTAADGTSTGANFGIVYLSSAGCGITGGWDSSGSGSMNGNSNSVSVPIGNCTLTFSASIDDPYGQAYIYCPPQTTSVFDPAYQVVSIVYAPPGNKSSNGYTNSTSNGTTTTIGNTFTQGGSITFTSGFSLFGVFGMSISKTGGASETNSNSSAFTESLTDASGLTNVSNPDDSNSINHNHDIFAIWLNPQVTVTGYGSTPVSYSVGVQPTSNGQTPGPDIIKISADVLEANSSGATTVPASWLNQQSDPATGQMVPGLASICKNLNVAEYQAGACTDEDQCGCTPADFAPILAQDPLLGYNGNQNPLDANNSQPSVCGTLPTPAGSDCRYVPVPDNVGSTVQEELTLSGPDSSTDNFICSPFTQNENQSTVTTLGGKDTEFTSVSIKEGGSGFSMTETGTWQWTQTQSIGTTTGTGVSQSVNLCSATIGCGAQIPVFEDTVYHTFVFMGGSASCP